MKEMKYMKHCVFFMGALLLLLSNSRAQDPHFSQFFASELYLNPALAGAAPQMTFGMNYRSQWSSLVKPYNTFQFSGIYPFHTSDARKRHYGGVGVSFFNDLAGNTDFRVTGGNISAAYNLPLSESGGHFLSFGLQGGFVQKGFDVTSGKWGSQYNPFIGHDNSINPGVGEINAQTTFMDVNAGIAWYLNPDKGFYESTGKFNAHLGIAGFHLNKPDESLIEGQSMLLPRLYKLHGGVGYQLSKHWHVSPNALALYQQHNYEINTGIYLRYQAFHNVEKGMFARSHIVMGSWHRFNDSFIFLLGMDHKKYTLGFSYDVTSSSLQRYNQGRGAYEISLTITLPNKTVEQHHTPRI